MTARMRMGEAASFGDQKSLVSMAATCVEGPNFLLRNYLGNAFATIACQPRAFPGPAVANTDPAAMNVNVEKPSVAPSDSPTLTLTQFHREKGRKIN